MLLKKQEKQQMEPQEMKFCHSQSKQLMEWKDSMKNGRKFASSRPDWGLIPKNKHGNNNLLKNEKNNLSKEET